MIAAQATRKVTLPSVAKAIAAAPAGKELLLGVEFRLKADAPLLKAGYAVARDQFEVRGYEFPTMESVIAGVDDCSVDEALAWVVIEAGGAAYTFNKRSGWIDYIDIDGKQYTKKGYSLKSDFWRAPTDNDYGAGLQRRLGAWRQPQYRVTSFNIVRVDGKAKGVDVSYDLNGLDAQMNISYRINSDGTLAVTQRLNAENSKTDLQRVGMTLVLDKEFDRIEYYGKGPHENYSDRNSSEWIGLYEESVAEQYFPYIRPQESGNKTEIRYWRVLNADGKGLEFYGTEPLSMSSLNYLTEDLDEGQNKHNLHSGDLTPRNLTVVHIDKVQSGLACQNSWGATPLEPYKLHPGTYEYTYVIKPVR